MYLGLIKSSDLAKAKGKTIECFGTVKTIFWNDHIEIEHFSWAKLDSRKENKNEVINQIVFKNYPVARLFILLGRTNLECICAEWSIFYIW